MAEQKKTTNTIRGIIGKIGQEPGVKIILRNPAFDLFVLYAELRKRQEPSRVWTIRELLNEVVYKGCKLLLEQEQKDVSQ